MNSHDTRDRLLDAAEHLFARHGIDATSLRAITSEAGTNLAAVNYHFGSKEALVDAVIGRRLSPINRERLRLLDEAEAAAGGGPPELDAIVEAFVEPALRLARDPAHGGTDFVRLMAQVHSGPDEQKQRLMAQFDETLDRFGAALSRALPHLGTPDLFWRFAFLIGSMVFSLGHGDLLKARSGGACDPSDVKRTLSHLVAFVSAGLRAPAVDQAGGKP